MKLLIITQKVDKDDQLLGFFIDWLDLLAKKFEKITILCLERGEFILPGNVQVLSLGKDRGTSKLKQLSNFYFLLFTLRNDYDAVFIHMNPLWVVLGGWYWHLTRKKIFFWYTSGGITTKLRLAEKFANTIFTASSESFRLPSKKIIVTGHGIDTELFRPSENLKIKSEKLKILSVGRISPVKNYEVLIDAAQILKNRGSDFLITIIGEAPLEKDKSYEENLKLKIKSLNLENNFDFIGKVGHKNLPAYYQSHDLFVHLSRTGSLDKTILEAMACRMNVLSSNDAARNFLPLELIFDGDNPKELADKIATTRNKEVNERLRQYVVENHNLSKLIDKISGIIINK